MANNNLEPISGVDKGFKRIRGALPFISPTVDKKGRAPEGTEETGWRNFEGKKIVTPKKSPLAPGFKKVG